MVLGLAMYRCQARRSGASKAVIGGLRSCDLREHIDETPFSTSCRSFTALLLIGDRIVRHPCQKQKHPEGNDLPHGLGVDCVEIISGTLAGCRRLSCALDESSHSELPVFLSLSDESKDSKNATAFDSIDPFPYSVGE